MRNLFIILFIFSSLSIKAQSNMELIQQEIDKTVWAQFKNAFETIDSEALNATYADDVLRVTPGGIDTGNTFKAKNTERFKMLNENGAAIQLDFWFESRHTNIDTSYEVGYFKMTTSQNNESSIFYGQFHVVLKKIDGSWKMTQDWDTTTINGQTIGKLEFERNGTNKRY